MEVGDVITINIPDDKWKTMTPEERNSYLTRAATEWLKDLAAQDNKSVDVRLREYH